MYSSNCVPVNAKTARPARMLPNMASRASTLPPTLSLNSRSTPARPLVWTAVALISTPHFLAAAWASMVGLMMALSIWFKPIMDCDADWVRLRMATAANRSSSSVPMADAVAVTRPSVRASSSPCALPSRTVINRPSMMSLASVAAIPHAFMTVVIASPVDIMSARITLAVLPMTSVSSAISSFVPSMPDENISYMVLAAPRAVVIRLSMPRSRLSTPSSV